MDGRSLVTLGHLLQFVGALLLEVAPRSHALDDLWRLAALALLALGTACLITASWLPGRQH